MPHQEQKSSLPSNRPRNLEDIAARAGVSRSTVSRVINNEPYVSQKTRDHVLKVIEQEGFSPNPVARMLVTQRTHTIGVVIPHTVNVVFEDPHYYPTLLEGVAATANERDYAMMLWIGESSGDETRFYQRILKNRLMDGLIMASPTSNTPFIRHLVETNTPLVMVERPDQYIDRISYVSIDNIQATHTAIHHLLGLGRRRIATVTGALDNVDGQDRLTGYEQVLKNAGLYDPDLVVEGRFSWASGYQGTQRLLQRAGDIDAIFAASDQTAMGVLQALHEAGKRIPEDIAVVGFDDLPSAVQANPPLTTIHHPIQQKGARAMSLLVDQIENPNDEPQQILLPVQLVIRQSCGAVTAP
jgi:LacI family transcriptional regulator